MQTSTQIFNYFDQIGNQTEQRKRHLLVRVIVPTDNASRDKIIKASNSQTSIPPAQLRATDEIHRDIEQFFKNQGYFYDRRKNFYKNAGKPRSSIVTIPELAQGITAILLREPNVARSRPASLLNDEARYQKIFNKQYGMDLYLRVAQYMKSITSFLRSEAGVGFSKELVYHLALYTVAKKIGKSRINAQDLIRDDAVIGSDLLTANAAEVEAIFLTVAEQDGSSFNMVAKSGDSTRAILAKLELLDSHQ